MSLNFVIMPGAKEFVLAQGGSVFIKPQPRLTSAGCGTPHIIVSPAVFLGKPPTDEENSYSVSEVNGVKVYIYHSLADYDSKIMLRIDMETTLFDRRLTMGGFPEGNCDSCDSCGSSYQGS